MSALVLDVDPLQAAGAAVPTTGGGTDSASATARWIGCVLDEIDYGMLLVDASYRVFHINRAADAELQQDHPLLLQGTEIKARTTNETQVLRSALSDACVRGLRRLLTLGADPRRISVAVVPLCPQTLPSAALLMLGKSRVCEGLSVDWFARSHGLTNAETTVLQHLCAGSSPAETARRIGVSIATVRTQLGSIRAKTGAASLRELLHQVAVLPPLVNVLHSLIH